jgi:hypothetical protein
MAPEPATPRKQLSGGWLVLALIVAGVAGIAFAGRVFEDATSTQARGTPQGNAPHCYEPGEADQPWLEWGRARGGTGDLDLPEIRFVTQSCHEVRLEAGQEVVILPPQPGGRTPGGLAGWRALKGRVEITWWGSRNYLKRLPDGVLTPDNVPTIHGECDVWFFKATEPSTIVVWANRHGPYFAKASDGCAVTWARFSYIDPVLRSKRESKQAAPK